MIAEAKPRTSAENHQTVLFKVAHDLRSPLMSIKGLIYLIQMESDINQKAKYFDLLEVSIARMNQTIDVIIRESKSEFVSSRAESICFKQIAQDAILSVRFMEEAEFVTIKLYTEEHQLFFCNQQSLISIFSNLITNAIRYRDRRKKSFLSIRITFNGAGAQITFRDNGIGIAEQYQKEIFNKFFRINSDRNGTGLGLHIVQECVQNLNGLLHLESNPDVGSTFTVFIPNQRVDDSI